MPDAYKDVSFFKIGKFIPWISDHCATHIQIILQNAVNKEISDTTEGEEHKTFYWGIDSTENYTKV